MATRSRFAKIGFLVFGLATAAYLAAQGPREQHVRFVLGDRAPEITGLDVQYVAEDGDVAREMRATWPAGAAPRVVSHEPKLPDGAYRLRIDVDAQSGRRSVERQVTLGGGSTQVDLSRANP